MDQINRKTQLELSFNESTKIIKLPQDYFALLSISERFINGRLLNDLKFVNGDHKITVENDHDYSRVLNYISLHDLSTAKILINETTQAMSNFEDHEESQVLASETWLNDIQKIIGIRLQELEVTIIKKLKSQLESNGDLSLSLNKVRLNHFRDKKEIIWANVVCNDCSKNIVGIRYKCSICSKFNLCSSCEELTKHKNSSDDNHIFIKIWNRDQLMQLKNKISNDETIVKINQNSSTEKLSARCFDTEKLRTVCIKENEKARINLRLVNDGKIIWPKNSSLACDEEKSQVIGKRVIFKFNISANEKINLGLSFDSENLLPGKYVSFWQLEDQNGLKFGEEITVRLKIIKRDT